MSDKVDWVAILMIFIGGLMLVFGVALVIHVATDVNKRSEKSQQLEKAGAYEDDFVRISLISKSIQGEYYRIIIDKASGTRVLLVENGRSLALCPLPMGKATPAQERSDLEKFNEAIQRP